MTSSCTRVIRYAHPLSSKLASATDLSTLRGMSRNPGQSSSHTSKETPQPPLLKYRQVRLKISAPPNREFLYASQQRARYVPSTAHTGLNSAQLQLTRPSSPAFSCQVSPPLALASLHACDATTRVIRRANRDPCLRFVPPQLSFNLTSPLRSAHIPRASHPITTSI